MSPPGSHRHSNDELANMANIDPSPPRRVNQTSIDLLMFFLPGGKTKRENQAERRKKTAAKTGQPQLDSCGARWDISVVVLCRSHVCI